ncbi:fungal pheromone STE3G-protein-coupled receptor, partial [Peniophora sp. CONT]
DPTYPLYPVAALLAAVMLLLVLLTNLIRQSWNLGIAFLCFWLFLDNIALAVNAIIWSDNYDVKLYAYCDIVSHLQLLCYIVRPITTLLVTRRLYLIARLQSVELPSKSARRRNLFIEWTLGLVVPVLVADYTVQAFRFEVIEGFGCTNAIINKGLPLILIDSWYVIPPLISVTIYCPLVVRIFYRHTREVNRFLRSNSSVSRTNYIRILALASVDIVFTLPIGIVNLVLDIQQSWRSGSSLTLYTSWAQVHSNWDPVGLPYSWILGTYLADQYVYNWTAPALAFAIFAIFGLTAEARTSYWRVICVVGGWFGWKPTPR